MGRRRLGRYDRPDPYPIAQTIEKVADRLPIAAAAGIWAKGGWVQIDASTASRVLGVVMAVIGGTAGSSFHIDVGTGAAAAEAVVIADLDYRTPAATEGPNPLIYRVHLLIPAGVRVAVRCGSNPGGGTVTISVWEEQEV